jgi:hypothetical protein
VFVFFVFLLTRHSAGVIRGSDFPAFARDPSLVTSSTFTGLFEYGGAFVSAVFLSHSPERQCYEAGGDCSCNSRFTDNSLFPLSLCNI